MKSLPDGVLQASDRTYIVDAQGSLRVNQYFPESSGGEQLERAARKAERQ